MYISDNVSTKAKQLANSLSGLMYCFCRENAVDRIKITYNKLNELTLP